MWSDTTARNRAHQQFGREHYWWLVGIKALPWVALLVASFYLFGVHAVIASVVGALFWLFRDSAHAVPTLIVFALAGLLLKYRWRRRDYHA